MANSTRTSKADEQDVSICETESFLQLVDVNTFNFAAGPKQPERPFSKPPLQGGNLFSTNYYHYVTQSGLKLRRYWYVIQAWTIFTASPAGYFLIKMSLQTFLRTSKPMGYNRLK